MAQGKDILALEPFYGGARKAMLEAMSRCSRHRWTIFKLPPRRIERRLAAASHWFAEQLARSFTGNVDLLMVSEALNLADLQRLMPNLGRKPSIVYFHANQLPSVGSDESSAGDSINLGTAAAATELWFNSTFNLRCFLERAEALVNKFPEAASPNLLTDFGAKSLQIAPPTDFGPLQQARRDFTAKRDIRSLFVDTRSANLPLLTDALNRLKARGEKFKLLVVGPRGDLDQAWEIEALSEIDEAGFVQKMLSASTAIATQFEAPWDYSLLMAMCAGCVPIAPSAGAYPELLPASLYATSLYDYTGVGLANLIQDRWHTEPPTNLDADIEQHLRQFSLANTCTHMDEQISRVISEQAKP